MSLRQRSTAFSSENCFNLSNHSLIVVADMLMLHYVPLSLEMQLMDLTMQRTFWLNT